jgi:hypothetical protein
MSRTRKTGRRRTLALAAALLQVTGCGAELQEGVQLEEVKAPGQWRAEVESHRAEVQPAILHLEAVLQSPARDVQRSRLGTVLPILEEAEETVPEVGLSPDLQESEIRMRYRSALRELRHGAHLMLQDLEGERSPGAVSSEVFIRRGLEELRKVDQSLASGQTVGGVPIDPDTLAAEADAEETLAP